MRLVNADNLQKSILRSKELNQHEGKEAREQHASEHDRILFMLMKAPKYEADDLVSRQRLLDLIDETLERVTDMVSTEIEDVSAREYEINHITNCFSLVRSMVVEAPAAAEEVIG